MLVTSCPATRAVRVVVLAAGRGSRLGARGEDTPKWLLRVGERTLADRHLEGFRAAGERVRSVSVVVGHAADAVASSLREGADDIAVVSNPQYAERNNWWSVLLALRELPDDGPVVIVNADLMIEPAQLGAFVADAATCAAEGLLAADLEQPVTDESMKVSRRADGTLDQIGKVGVREPAGEYVGMLMARDGVLHAFRAALESFDGRAEHANEWYEAAVARTADAVAWHLWPVAGGSWVEIDDDVDLSAAVRLEARR